MTLDEYWAKVHEYALSNQQQRYGQAAFNVLVSLRPDLSEKIRGTKIDPFYRADRFSAFEAFLSENWE